LREKTFLAVQRLPYKPLFRGVKARSTISYQCMRRALVPVRTQDRRFLATTRKGHARLESFARTSKRRLPSSTAAMAILRTFVDFEKERSPSSARPRPTQTANFAHYTTGITERHRERPCQPPSLDVSSFRPGECHAKSWPAEAVESARSIAEAFDYVGTPLRPSFIS
jgi:hypothetical protein